MDVSIANLMPTDLSSMGIISLLQSAANRGGSSTPISSQPFLLGSNSGNPDVCGGVASDGTCSLDSIENLSPSTNCSSSTTASMQFSCAGSKTLSISSPTAASLLSSTQQKALSLCGCSSPHEFTAMKTSRKTASDFHNIPTSSATTLKNDFFIGENDIITDFDNLISPTARASACESATGQSSKALITSQSSDEVILSQSLNSGSCGTSTHKALLSYNDPLKHGQRRTTGKSSVSQTKKPSQSPQDLIQQLHLQQKNGSQLFNSVSLAAAAASSNELRQQMQFSTNSVPYSVLGGAECISTPKAVAFLAGPRERIHVLGNPVEFCPRCQQEGLGSTGWRPHRHIGELKIRYICERHFDNLESRHHFDIPLCPVCNQVLYLYDFNSMLGVSNARRLHRYVLKCANRHVLPLLDLFCQTKKGGERCIANFKLQWCYGTMVKRCEAQKNRDHDLWWVRYKNEWKQRRTIIRYKKDFLSHLSDVQRSLLLGLGVEGEPPPDPKAVLGSTFDTLLSSVVGTPNGPKLKKRSFDRTKQEYLSSSLDTYGGSVSTKQQRCRQSVNYSREFATDYTNALLQNNCNLGDRHHGLSSQLCLDSKETRNVVDDGSVDPLRYVMGAVVFPTQNLSNDSQLLVYLSQQQSATNSTTHQYSSPPDSTSLTTHKLYIGSDHSSNPAHEVIPASSIITGTPTAPLPNSTISPVAVSVIGEVLAASSIDRN